MIRAPAILTDVPAPLLFLAGYDELEEACARRDTVGRRWSALLGGSETEVADFLAAPGSDRGLVAVDALPTAADLSGLDERGWLAFTRPVETLFG